MRLRHSKVHAADCSTCERDAARLDRIEREIVLTDTLDGDQQERLLQIADRCPVHRTLTSTVQIESRLA